MLTTLNAHTLNTHRLNTHMLNTHTVNAHMFNTHTLDTHRLNTNVYALKPKEGAFKYEKLKIALLNRYDLTEEGFKRKHK